MADDPSPGTSSGRDGRGDEPVLRVSTLCSRPVIGEDGRRHGTVLDVRVVRDGPTNVSGDARFRIDGLLVGSDGWGERMGLFRRAVHGPWLLEAMARLVGPTHSYLPWSQVIDPRGVAADDVIRFRGELTDPEAAE
jgi:hypothetical protein